MTQHPYRFFRPAPRPELGHERLRRLDRLPPRKLKGVRWTRPRVVHPTVSNTHWEMDLTYVWCGRGFGYLFAVLDAYDKGVPGAHFGDRCRSPGR